MQTSINTMTQRAQAVISGYFVQKESGSFLSNVVVGSWILLGAVTAVQFTFYPVLLNLISIVYVALAWALTTSIFFSPKVLKSYPLSSFLVIGFACTQFYFPLVFTTIEGKPLIHNLDMPLQVFLHSTLALLTLSTTHALYRTLMFRYVSKPTRGPALLRKAALFATPSDQQVWLMGLLGLLAMFYSSFVLTAGGNTEVGAGGKIIEALIAFTYAPFFIPFGKLYGRQKTETTNLGVKLLIFGLALLVISIGRNSRGAFMIGFTSLGFAFALGLMLGVIRTRIFTLKYAIIASAAVWLLTGPLSDLGNAMVLVRHQRNDVPKSDMIKLTLEAYKDKAAIKEHELNTKLSEGDWDEKYLDNIFLARFCNIKFNDISLVLASQLESGNANMRDFSIDRIWSTFPQPVLSILNPSVDKLYVNGMSFGDYLRFQVSKSQYNLGSFVTGHLSGTGMAAFGWAYLLVLALGILPVYFLIDLLHIKKHLVQLPGVPVQAIERRFSLCALLNLTYTFQFLPGESVVTCVQFICRGWFQMLMLYFFLFHLTKTMKLFTEPVIHFFKR